MIEAHELKTIMPLSKNIDKYFWPLNNAMMDFQILSRLRMCAFIAQIAHESGQLNYCKELASGADYDIGNKAKSLGNTPEDDGDGERFKGRGLIQLTGRNNYTALSKVFGIDFIKNPELLETPEWAAKSAAWFWKINGLNEHADKGEFKIITRKINGGYNHLAQRQAFYTKALEVIK